jgi:hypothetical protein
VIILVLLLILLMPLFSVDYWVQPESSQTWAVTNMNEMLVNKAGNEEINLQSNLIVDLYAGELGKHYPLMKLEVPKYELYPGFSYTSSTYTDELDKYRLNELIKVQSSSDDDAANVEIVLDGRIVAKK